MRPHVHAPGHVHLIDGDLLQRTGNLHPGMGMQHIQPPVTGGRVGNGCLKGCIVGHIQRQRLGQTTRSMDLCGHARGPVAVQIGDDHAGPFGSHGKRPRPADAGSGPCHESDALVQKHGRVRSEFRCGRVCARAAGSPAR